MAVNKDKFNGLTDDQVAAILFRIAVTANLMSDICRSEATRSGLSETANTFHALDSMLSGVGAMADHAIGGEVMGDFPDWLVGPSFNSPLSNGGAA